MQLDAFAGGPGGFGRYAGQVAAAQALPTVLRSKGSAFSVKYRRETAAQPSSGYPGYGYGDGYGYGYGN